MKITPEQHQFLIDMGFSERNQYDTFTSYWHEGTAILLHCETMPSLDHYRRKENCLDVVVAVPDSIPAELAAALPDFATEVIRFKDLPQFMMYRAFSEECAEHRLAKASFERTRDAFHEAEANEEAAKQFVHLAAASLRQEVDAVLALTKPPAFSPVALA